MTKASLELLIRGLNGAEVRYLVVGGLAVNAHGYMRLTLDVDLILGFAEANLRAGLKVLKGMGYKPMVPVDLEDFSDENNRRSWHEEKHMVAFPVRSEAHRDTNVDLFVTDPLGFDEAYQRAESFELAPDVAVRICSYDDLVRLKKAAGRPKDLLDLEQLRKARGSS